MSTVHASQLLSSTYGLSPALLWILPKVNPPTRPTFSELPSSKIKVHSFFPLNFTQSNAYHWQPGFSFYPYGLFPGWDSANSPNPGMCAGGNKIFLFLLVSPNIYFKSPGIVLFRTECYTISYYPLPQGNRKNELYQDTEIQGFG